MDYTRHIQNNLNKANRLLHRFLQEYFKDPRVELTAKATIDDYLKAGITDKRKILDLLENDVWPMVEGRPDYATPVRCGTDYCLEGYTNCGIEKAATMFRLRDDGITPFQIRNIGVVEGKYVLRVNSLRALREKYYSRPRGGNRSRRIIDTISGHATRYALVPGITYLEFINKQQ